MRGRLAPSLPFKPPSHGGWSNRFASIEHARLKLRAWIHAYNHERPHQSLNDKTPNQ
ncbi:MAG: hypothetical protein EOP84_26340 [Verrucomicrobiaceae bacterium]|nr:MAG: hypothetical protein EOP84_26340 [Verrucomicrobiaceae bacterium]